MSLTALHHEFRVGRATISHFLPDVLQAIYDCLKTDYVQVCTFATLHFIGVNMFNANSNCRASSL